MSKDVVRLGGIAVVLLVLLWVAASFYRDSKEREQSQRLEQQVQANATAFVRPYSHSLGPPNAKVTIVEFFDPECSACGRMYPVVKRILAEYRDSVRLVVRYLPVHPGSMAVIGALEAAAAQDRYWDMLNVLMLQQSVWAGSAGLRTDLIPRYAEQVGLDLDAFNRFLAAGTYKSRVIVDRSDALALGVRGTPTLFVNERPLSELSYQALKARIDQELAR